MPLWIAFYLFYFLCFHLRLVLFGSASSAVCMSIYTYQHIIGIIVMMMLKRKPKKKLWREEQKKALSSDFFFKCRQPNHKTDKNFSSFWRAENNLWKYVNCAFFVCIAYTHTRRCKLVYFTQYIIITQW